MAVTKIEGPERMAVQPLPQVYVPQTGDMWALLSRTLQERKALALRERERQDQFALLDKGHANELDRMTKAAEINEVFAANQAGRQQELLRYGHDLDEQARTKQLEDMTYGAQMRRQGASLTGNPNISVDDSYKILSDFSSRLEMDAAKRASTIKSYTSKENHTQAFRENMAELASNLTLRKMVDTKAITSDQVVKTVVKKFNDAQSKILNLKNLQQSALGSGTGAVDALVSAANSYKAPTPTNLAQPSPKGLFDEGRANVANLRVGGSPTPTPVGSAPMSLDQLTREADARLAAAGGSPSPSPQDRSNQTWRLLKENMFDRFGSEDYTKLAEALYSVHDKGLTPEQLRADPKLAPLFSKINGDAVVQLRGYMVGALSELRKRTIPDADFSNATTPAPGEDPQTTAARQATASQAPRVLKIKDLEVAKELDKALTRMVALTTPVVETSLSDYSRDYAKGQLMLEKAQQYGNTDELVKEYQKALTIQNLTQAHANAPFTDYKDDPDFKAIMAQVPPETRARVETEGATIHSILMDAEVQSSLAASTKSNLETGAARLQGIVEGVEPSPESVESVTSDILDTGINEELVQPKPLDYNEVLSGLSPEGLEALEATMNKARPPTLMDTMTRGVLSTPDAEAHMKNGFEMPDIWGRDTFPNLTPNYTRMGAAEMAKTMMAPQTSTVSPNQVAAPKPGATAGPEAQPQRQAPQGPTGPRGPMSPLAPGSKPMAPIQGPQKIGGQRTPLPPPPLQGPPAPATPMVAGPGPQGPPPGQQGSWDMGDMAPPIPPTQPFWR